MDTQTYHFGTIENYVFLGGTPLLGRILEKIKTTKPITVISSDWHLNESSHIPGKTFEQFLRDRGVPFNLAFY